MAEQRRRSFADPDTEFILERSDTPVDVDGFKLGEPTGEITCAECKMSAGAPEYIPHLPGCSQRDVRSEWWWMTHRVGEHPHGDQDGDEQD